MLFRENLSSWNNCILTRWAQWLSTRGNFDRSKFPADPLNSRVMGSFCSMTNFFTLGIERNRFYRRTGDVVIILFSRDETTLQVFFYSFWFTCLQHWQHGFLILGDAAQKEAVAMDPLPLLPFPSLPTAFIWKEFIHIQLSFSCLIFSSGLLLSKIDILFTGYVFHCQDCL